MSKMKDLLLLGGIAAAFNTPFVGTGNSKKQGFKKSVIPSKDYAKRKRRLRISGASRNINHRLNK